MAARSGNELVVLASFSSQVRGVMFNEYALSGASVGAHVSLVRKSHCVYDGNCVEVQYTNYGWTYLLGHLAAGTASLLSPLLLNSSLVATG